MGRGCVRAFVIYLISTTYVFLRARRRGVKGSCDRTEKHALKKFRDKSSWVHNLVNTKSILQNS